MSKTKQDLLNRMQQLDACASAPDWVYAQSEGSAQAIWDSCNEPDWLLWYAARNGTSDKTLRQLACVFARSVLFLVPEGDDRPRIAIETAERFIEGRATPEELTKARRNAGHAAAADAADAAAAAAADAADAAAAYAAAAAAAYTAATYTADAAYAAAADAAAAAAADTRTEVKAEFCKVIRKAIPAIPFGGES